MTDIAIECTLCDKTFPSEDAYSSHECSAEEDMENSGLLPVKDEPMDFEMPEVDCQLTEVKDEVIEEQEEEEEEEEVERTTVEVDPLALLADDEIDITSGTFGDLLEIENSENLYRDQDELGKENSASVLSKCLNKYNCKICGDTFTRKDIFTKHFRSQHNTYRPYECKVCKKKFLHKHYVTLHMRVHTGEKPYKCPLCPKAYSHKTSYTIHMRIHSGERPYVCSVCGKRCYDKSGLTSHMRSHTKETPYQCEVCGRRFTHSKSLLVHRRNHTGEKPYVCSYCGKAFRHWHKHKIHVRLHTGERPYKCKVCNKGFPRNDEVARHMKSHTGIKSFKCSICGVYCATQASITGHIDLHHKNLKEESEEPPEKTLVQDSKSGILGSRVPEPRSIYKKVASTLPSFSEATIKTTYSVSTATGPNFASNKAKIKYITKSLLTSTKTIPSKSIPSVDSKDDSSGESSTSRGASTSMKSPTRVIEITSKDIPLPMPIKAKNLHRTMPRPKSPDPSTSAKEETPALNMNEFLEWQQRMLTKQGLVVKGVSDKKTDTAAPIKTLPTFLKTSDVVGGNLSKGDKSKPQYILITQGTGPTATKILLPLSMAGNMMQAKSTDGVTKPMILMQQNKSGGTQQPMMFMAKNNSQKMFVVSQQKAAQQPIVKLQIPNEAIKKEPLDIPQPLITDIKQERPDSPLNVTINGLSVSIKKEPRSNDT